jgi:hypothetical protein
MPRLNLPLDPGCPEWEEAMGTLWEDPMTAYSGVGDEVLEGMEKVHRNKCERCREYGAANIEVA